MSNKDQAVDLQAQLKALTARVDELESREVFHDYTIETLNQTIIEQQATIERLVRVSQQLIDKVKEMPGSEDKAWAPEDEVPPHY